MRFKQIHISFQKLWRICNFRSKFTLVAIFLLLVISFAYYIILYSYLSFGTIVSSDLSPHNSNNISCYDWSSSNSLPESSETIKAEEKNIFFIETSCEGSLNSRQACSVESAARLNPEWQIHLIFAGPVTAEKLNNSILKDLIAMPNVKVSRMLLSELLNETSTLKLKEPLLRSKYAVSHASDIYRYLVLYKYPGVYLDLDMMVSRPFGTLSRDFACRESKYIAASFVLGFSASPIGRRMAHMSKVEIGRTFNPDVWGSNGPGVVTRALKQLCLAQYRKTPDSWHAETCQGFEIYDKTYFSPYINYFLEDEEYFGIAYTHHFFNKLTHGMVIKNGSLYTRLARKNCPTVCKVYGSRFGT